jgi:cysteine desulfurase
MIYLDYAASTPVDNDVLDNFIKITKEEYANPNSNHDLGFHAKKIIDEATDKIANLLNVSSEEIIYTSGATESNNLAIRGVAERYKNKGKHIIVSSLEHNSIIASCTYLQENGFDIDLIPINRDGLVDIETLKQMIRDDTILVSVCAVDSEIGLKQPIEEIGEFLKTKENILFHTDASQAIGKVDIDYSNCDLITIAPHKFYGMNGISILIKKKNVSLKPLILGGKSTTVYRSGTPIVSMISSTSVALEKAINMLEERNTYIEKINKIIVSKLKEYKNVHINNTDKSIPHTINFSIKGIKSDLFASKLNDNKVMISTKTSCCPLNTPSKLVYALTKDKSLASTSLRISISHLTTEEEINNFLIVFDKCYKDFA